MYKLCRINIEDRETIYERLRQFARLLKSKHKVKKVYLYGAFAKGDFHEASDIDLIIVGEFEGRMHERIGKIFDLTSLPVEPLVYTEAEFQQMKERPFLKEVLATARSYSLNYIDFAVTAGLPLSFLNIYPKM